MNMVKDHTDLLMDSSDVCMQQRQLLLHEIYNNSNSDDYADSDD